MSDFSVQRIIIANLVEDWERSALNRSWLMRLIHSTRLSVQAVSIGEIRRISVVDVVADRVETLATKFLIAEIPEP